MRGRGIHFLTFPPEVDLRLDILYEINVGIFEIEEAKTHIITQLNFEQKELLNLFKVEQRLFTHFAEAQKACRLTYQTEFDPWGKCFLFY